MSFAPTVFVLPKEPAISGARGGSVDLLVWLRSDGRVRKLCVLDSEPLGVFESVAVEAVAQWRYAAKDVMAVARRRAKVHVAFQLN